MQNNSFLEYIPTMLFWCVYFLLGVISGLVWYSRDKQIKKIRRIWKRSIMIVQKLTVIKFKGENK